MSQKHQILSETHIVGERTTEWIVRKEQCPRLAHHQIAHVGVADASTPYSMVRTHLNGAYLLACFAGAGSILLDGRWQRCDAGTACLAPPHVLHAFHAVPGKRWGFAWVKYETAADQAPLITSGSPVMAAFASEPLHDAIMGLYHENANGADGVFLKHWVDLIHQYVLRFAQPWHLDQRLSPLWDAVVRSPGEPWSLERLAKACHMSGEHLRRLCRRHLGRSPMQHVTYLRMQRASELLEETTHKIETIAAQVGYENPFVFSTTFKRWIGWRPSEYRKRKMKAV